MQIITKIKFKNKINNKINNNRMMIYNIIIKKRIM